MGAVCGPVPTTHVVTTLGSSFMLVLLLVLYPLANWGQPQCFKQESRWPHALNTPWCSWDNPCTHMKTGVNVFKAASYYRSCQSVFQLLSRWLTKALASQVAFRAARELQMQASTPRQRKSQTWLYSQNTASPAWIKLLKDRHHTVLLWNQGKFVLSFFRYSASSVKSSAASKYHLLESL